MDAAAAVSAVRGVQAGLSMLLSLHLTDLYFQTPKPTATCYDYIIVGGGTGGCVIANRLTEDPGVNVLIVEAGGDPPFQSMVPGLLEYLPQTETDWNITEEYDQNRAQYQNNVLLPLLQGKMLGGSSSNNIMSYIRGHSRDYQCWADIANDLSWTFPNVLPYFKKSENLVDQAILNSTYGQFHATNGPIGVTREPKQELEVYLQMFRELGHETPLDFNDGHPLGYGQPTYNIVKGRQSTATSFLSPVKSRKNLHVLKNTLVTKILFDESNNAVGVKALTKDRKTITLTADKEVIVTAGALNTPKLLMLSGIGPNKHLSSFGINTISNLPVGQNLQDHVNALVAYKFKKSDNPPPLVNFYQFPIPTLGGFVALNTSRIPTYGVAGFSFPNDATRALQLCASYLNLEYNVCQAIYEAGKGNELLVSLVALFRPESRGTVELRSTNPEDKPLVSLKSYSVQTDLEVIARSLEDYDQLQSSSYFKSVGGELVDHNLPKCCGLSGRDYWRCHALSTRLTLSQFCGTAAMGSVLDSKLRVRGVRRLRVADSSAFPVIPRANVMAPTIMLAEKAADLIKDDN